MSRVFLMKWYHFTVEYFEDLRNVDHCEFLLMRKQENGKFLLETKLRTWSELRRERALANTTNNNNSKEKDEEVKLERSRTFVVTRRWGGCPNGCNHTNHYKKRHDLEALREKDNELSSCPENGTSTIASRRHRHKSNVSIGDGDDEHSDQHIIGTQLEKTRSLDEIISSPDGTPSFITAEDRARNLKSPHLHVGRDFGGTYSGHASLAGSESDGSSDEARRHHRHLSMRTKNNHNGSRARDGETSDSSAKRERYANRLGDAPPTRGVYSDMEDLDKAEKEDRSIRGSVY